MNDVRRRSAPSRRLAVSAVVLVAAWFAVGCSGVKTTGPDETAPAETTAESSVPDDRAGTDDEPAADDKPAADDEVEPVLVALAVAGLVALLGIAGWWMLRRSDPDDEVGRPDDDHGHDRPST